MDNETVQLPAQQPVPEKKKKNSGEKIGAFFSKLWLKLWKWILSKKLYILIFMVPFAIMYIAYAVFEVHPWGDNSVLVLDLNGQYVYYYEMMRDALHGKASLIYSWGRNLSGELFGIYAYYLASPFMIIPCLVPETWMLGAVEFVQLAKIGTAAVTFAFYLKKIGNRHPTSLVVFSSCYALMAYMVVELMDPMWLDGLIYLPLIIWGVHRLYNDGKILPFAIPLSLMFMAHFYIGYMVGIFTGIYFVIMFFTREGSVVPKHFGSILFKFAFGTVTAIVAASAVLLTVYNSLQLGKFEFTTPDFSLKTQFDLFTFSTNLFPMTYDTVRPEGPPIVYCGVLTLIMVPLFFLNSKIKIKEKVCNGLAALLILICMYLAPLDIMFHGFQVPNWLPYRYSFTFCFLLVYMAYRAFDNLDGISFRELGGVVFALFVYLIYFEHEKYDYFQTFTVETIEGQGNKYTIQGIWVSMIALIVYFGVTHIIKSKKSFAASVVLVAAVSVELFGNTLDTLNKIDKDVVYSTYSSYYPYITDLKSTVAQVKEDDDSFYRMEANFHRTVNDPIGTGYAGISHSSSTMNAPALLALKYLGYTYGGHYTKYDGATPLTDALFGIKYLMDRPDGSYQSSKFWPEQYPLAYSMDELGTPINVYQNPYALSVGYVADAGVTDFTFDEFNPFENQNQLLNKILGADSDTDFFTRVQPEQTESVNLTEVNVSNHHTKYTFESQGNPECHIDYVFTMAKTEHLYMFLPTQYEHKVNVWVEDDPEYADGIEDEDFDFAGSFFEGDDYSIMDLGQYAAGDSVRVRISILTDTHEAYWKEELFYTFDWDAFSAAMDTMQTRNWQLTKHTDTYLEGTVSAQGNQVLFTTIPYELGWTIQVDGQSVEPLKTGDTFMTIPLSAGTHTVTMRFLPNYFVLSLILSAVGILVFVLIFLFEYKNGILIARLIRKQKNRTEAAKNRIDKA